MSEFQGFVYAQFPNNIEENKAIYYKKTKPMNIRVNINVNHITYIGTHQDENGVELNKNNIGHGLFGTFRGENDEIINVEDEDIEEITKHIRQITKKDIYLFKGAFSLSEEEAKRNNVNKDFYELWLKNKISEIAKANNLKEEDIEWCAAYHPKKGHPHCHFVFWDRNQYKKTKKFPKCNWSEMRKILNNCLEERKIEKQNIEQIKNEARKNISKLTDEELEKYKDNIKNKLNISNLEFNFVDTTKEEKLIKNLAENLKDGEKIYLYNKNNPEQFVEIMKKVHQDIPIKNGKLIFNKIKDKNGNPIKDETGKTLYHTNKKNELYFKNNGKNSLLYEDNNLQDSCSFLTDFENIGMTKDKKILEQEIEKINQEKENIDELLKEINPEIIPTNIFSFEFKNNYLDEIVTRISNLPEFILKENSKKLGENLNEKNPKIDFRYGYQTLTVKKEIDKISNLIISCSEDVRNEYNNYISSSIEIAKLNGNIKNKYDNYYRAVLQRAKDEMFNKMGNKILQNLKENLNQNRNELYHLKQEEYERKKQEYEHLQNEKKGEYERKYDAYRNEMQFNNVRGLISDIFKDINRENISQDAGLSRMKKSFKEMTKEQMIAEIKKKQNSSGYDWYPEQ